MAEKFSRLDVAEYLDTEEDMALYPDACLKPDHLRELRETIHPSLKPERPADLQTPKGFSAACRRKCSASRSS